MAKEKDKKKGKRESGKVVDYKLAVAVSDQVSIENVRLIHCNCYQTPSAAQGKHTLEIDYETKAETDKKKGYVLVFPTFKLEAFPLAGNRKKPDLVIEATFVIIYKARSLKGLGEANFEAFANSNGVYNAWPYWREFVQNTVARMCLPPLTIPVFRLVPEKIKKTKAKKTMRKSSAQTKVE